MLSTESCKTLFVRHGRRARALVVDDDHVMRYQLVAMLINEGFEVHEAEHAEGALAQLHEHNYDLVMLDYAMPGMNGGDLCQLIRYDLDLAEMPVIAYTAHGDVTSVATMRLAGFNDFLFKPVNYRRLEQVLDRFIPSYSVPH
jgi:CheY-like chemotaxis protein